MNKKNAFIVVQKSLRKMVKYKESRDTNVILVENSF